MVLISPGQRLLRHHFPPNFPAAPFGKQPAPINNHPLRTIRTDLPAFGPHLDQLYSIFHGFYTF